MEGAAMSVMTMVQALNNAMDVKLEDDPNVIIYGEDVGIEGGVFRVTEKLGEKYGDHRVFDSPLAESGIIGSAVGMAAAGLRPVVEMQFSGFFYPGFNQTISHLSRMRNRTRGRIPMPVTVRMPYGGGVNALEHHSESMEAIFAHIPGLHMVIPSTPYDAKGLLIASIESNDPVIFFEPKRVYRSVKQEVPTEIYRIPLGKAKVLEPGKDLTLVSYGAMLHQSIKAVQAAQKRGWSVELIDLRTIKPLDRETIARSVRKTGRFLAAHEASEGFGVGAELISVVTEEAFSQLIAPPTRIGGFDTIIPYPRGEHNFMVDDSRILYEIERLMEY
jgi:pyruvate dehydrogenase E1 component beta subunit